MFDLFKRKNPDKTNVHDENNIYDSMRRMAFNITPEKLEVSLENDEQVYGAIVDMPVGKGFIATMVCFIDGTASLYFSNGGGIIGAGQHENVRKAATSFLVSIHQVLPIMKPVENTSLIPKDNHHIFYLFTRTGIFTLDLDINEYQKNKETHFLFSLAQMVLTEIRSSSEQSGVK